MPHRCNHTTVVRLVFVLDHLYHFVATAGASTHKKPQHKLDSEKLSQSVDLGSDVAPKWHLALAKLDPKEFATIPLILKYPRGTS